MGQGKIDVTIGNLSFSGEGDQEWLSEQLYKVLKAVPKIETASPPTTAPEPGASDKGADGTFTTPLAVYIREKRGGRGRGAGGANQVGRFLTTADWLRRRGNDGLTTAAVTQALRDNQQKRLGNPADCLNKNVSKGFCEKNSGGFFITSDDLTKLGSQ